MRMEHCREIDIEICIVVRIVNILYADLRAM